MIEFQQERDRRRFMKRNLEISKAAELKAEEQRVELGQIDQVRRPLIDKVYRLPITLRPGS